MTPDPLLLAAIRAVARSGDPDATLDELLEICLRAGGAERGAAFLWDASRGGLATAGSRGYVDGEVEVGGATVFVLPVDRFERL